MTTSPNAPPAAGSRSRTRPHRKTAALQGALGSATAARRWRSTSACRSRRNCSPGSTAAALARLAWFPLIRQGDAVVVAAADPRDPALEDAVRRAYGAQTRGGLGLLCARTSSGSSRTFSAPRSARSSARERTGLAAWRTTMAQWRTRLACYRTDLARGRTFLAVLRWGLGLLALADALLRARGRTVAGASPRGDDRRRPLPGPLRPRGVPADPSLAAARRRGTRPSSR